MAECDVVIVGAGPAGAIAGTILARAGARVRLIDRAIFPRDKLCGDTVNPGALGILTRLGLGGDVEARSLRVDGMVVTGERGIAIEGRYPSGVHGRAIVRRDFDWLLLQQAIRAGCEFEPRVAAQRAIVAGQDPAWSVGGVVALANGRERPVPARVTIAADGRRSVLAFGLGLARHPARPRRWAIGGYFEGFGSLEDGGGTEGGRRREIGRGTVGEMHVRSACYLGVARVPGDVTNVCLVKATGPRDTDLRDPAGLLIRELARDPQLRDRSAGARLVAPPVVLGPLAVDVRRAAIDGLILAGDAAGFIDPMTGDGLRFAIRGGELAAAAALQALEHGWPGVHTQLHAERRRAFGGKWAFNRALRALVASPHAIDLAARGARLAPGVLRAVIARAGDCHVAD